MHDYLREMQYLYKHSEDAYGTIAGFLLEQLTLVPDMNINDVAKACFTSAPTIVRFCKKIGFSGFADLKLYFAKQIAVDPLKSKHKADFQSGYIYSGESKKAIKRIVTNLTVDSIVESTRLLSDELLAKLVDLIYQSEQIDFYGAGASNLVAADFHYRFMRAGIRCTSASEMHMQYAQAQASRRGVVAFGISYSGETDEICAILASAKERGATTVSMTAYTDNQLAALADINIFMASMEAADGFVAASSRIAMLHCMDVIYSVYASTYADEVRIVLADTKSMTKK